MKNLSFVIISLHLLVTQLPQGYGLRVFNFWSGKPECLPCFKKAQTSLFQKLLALSPKCGNAARILNDIDNTSSTYFASYSFKRICKKNNPEEYKEGMKKLQDKGRDFFHYLQSWDCSFKLADKYERRIVAGWFKKFEKATKACKDPDHLKNEAEYSRKIICGDE